MRWRAGDEGGLVLNESGKQRVRTVFADQDVTHALAQSHPVGFHTPHVAEGRQAEETISRAYPQFGCTDVCIAQSHPVRMHGCLGAGCCAGSEDNHEWIIRSCAIDIERKGAAVLQQGIK